MKRIRKTVTVIFALIVALFMSLPANADTLVSEKLATTIDAQLQSRLQEAHSDERIPVDIWLYDTGTNQAREAEIYAKIGVNKAQILTSANNLHAAERVDEYIKTERAIYAAERAEQYAAFRLDYSSLGGLQETRQAETRLFYSQYAPMVSAELTVSEIKLLARDNRVQTIYYSPDVILESEGDVSVPTINADYTRDVSDCTGSGIKIGLIEADGFPDITADYLEDADITLEPGRPQVYKYHATMVTAIMVAQESTVDGITYEGIVPNASLYASYYRSGDPDDWRVRVEWLISQNVHVINMSAGFKNQPAGLYDTHARWLDHVAIDHCIHFVKSAGNENNAITSPGMAYNILTVGAINDNNTLSPDDDERYYSVNPINDRISGSNYVEDDNLTNKPDVMAPGVQIGTAAGNASGTSLSAPHVTAVVAQLCEAQPVLIAFPERIKAILTASITHEVHTYTCADSNYDKYGAGVIDAKAALDTATNIRFYSTDFLANSAANTQNSYSFTISTPNTPTRVSLSWLMESSLSGTHASAEANVHTLADLTLYIYGPNGEQIGNWHAENQNTQIADFIAEEIGTYRMVVKLNETTTTFVYAALAWYFYDA